MYEGNPRAEFIAVPDIDPKTGKSNFDYDYDVGFDEKYFHDMEMSMDDVSYRCLYKSDPIEREGILYIRQNYRDTSEDCRTENRIPYWQSAILRTPVRLQLPRSFLSVWRQILSGRSGIQEYRSGNSGRTQLRYACETSCAAGTV